MKQTLHIFRKDVRCLWPALLVMLASQAAFVYSNVRHSWGGSYVYVSGITLEPVATLAMLFSWWYVIISLIHQEPIPGDRQFWTTRPYSWKCLLAAKLLFIFVFISLAVFIADWTILSSHHFSPVSCWPALFWRHIPFTAVVILPFVALACVTRHLGQIILTLGAFLVLTILNSLHSDQLPVGPSPLSWINIVIIEVFVLVLLLAAAMIQYRNRATWWIRGVLAASFFLFGAISLPDRWEFALQNHFRPPQVQTSVIRMALDTSRSHRTDRTHANKFTIIPLPLTVVGVPNGVELISRVADVMINGESFPQGAHLERYSDGYWIDIYIPNDVFRALRTRPVRVNLRPVVTVLKSNDLPLAAEGRITTIAPGEQCQWIQVTNQLASVSCQSAFTTPQRSFAYSVPPGPPERSVPSSNPQSHPIWFGDQTDSPLPAELCLSPLSSYDHSAKITAGSANLYVRVQQPLAHYRAEIEIDGLKLDDYALPRQ